jgi:hypothetical protein
MTLPEEISYALSYGMLPAAELIATVVERTKVSPATVRRCLDEMGSDILRLGNARATRYGMRHQVPYAKKSSWPIAECDAQGKVHDLGTLYALRGDKWYVEPAPGVDANKLWKGSNRGVFNGLPWFLDTARPQGFLGRIFATKAHHLMGFPADPTMWSDDHTVVAAMYLGADIPGNILLGDAVARHRAKEWLPSDIVADPDDATWDATLLSWVDSIIAGEAIGSGVGGEQPKFVIESEPRTTGPVRHRLVKFSPALASDGAKRMGDLLVAEHVANEVLARAGFAVAQTCVRNIKGTLKDGSADLMVLESERFDRVNHEGRVGVSSLEAPANTFGCAKVSWITASKILEEQGVISSADTSRILFLEEFGRGIGNTDRHLGNVSLIGSAMNGWSLAPVYDMVPMSYIPGRTLEVKNLKKVINDKDVPAEVRSWVRDFWQTLAAHPLLTEEFRSIAQSHADDLPDQLPVRPDFGDASPSSACSKVLPAVITAHQASPSPRSPRC